MKRSILICLALCVAWTQAKAVAKDEETKKEELYNKLINDLSEVFHTKEDSKAAKKEVKDTSEDDKRRELLGELKDLLKTASKSLDNDLPEKKDSPHWLWKKTAPGLRWGSDSAERPQWYYWKKDKVPGLRWNQDTASSPFGLPWKKDSSTNYPGLPWKKDSSNSYPGLPWKRDQDKRAILVQMRDMLSKTLNEMDRQDAKRSERPRHSLNMANGRGGDALSDETELLSKLQDILKESTTSNKETTSDNNNDAYKRLINDLNGLFQKQDNSEKYRMPSLAEIIQLLEEYKENLRYLQTNKVEDKVYKREELRDSKVKALNDDLADLVSSTSS